MKEHWNTTQVRVRDGTHDYLTQQAANAGVSITQVVGVLLDYCARSGLQILQAVAPAPPPHDPHLRCHCQGPLDACCSPVHQKEE